MTRQVRLLLPALLAGLLAGCAPGQATFITKSSLGLEVDGQPPRLAVGYDRVEGLLAPGADKGAVPSAFAFIQTGAGFLGQNGRQTYATGIAANIIACDRPLSDDKAEETCRFKADDVDLKRSGQTYVFFGTETSYGVKLGYNGTGSVLLGLRRTEMSTLPLSTNAQGDNAYPSVLASFDGTVDARAGGPGGGPPAGDPVRQDTLSAVQFFATGTAAQSLAREPRIREALRKQAQEEVLKKYRDVELEQGSIVAKILRCYKDVPDSAEADIWKDAADKGAISSGYAMPMGALAAAIDAASRAKARSLYLDALSVNDGFDAARLLNLTDHADYVCSKKS